MVVGAAVALGEAAVCFDFGAISIVKILKKRLRENLKALGSKDSKSLKISQTWV